MRKFLVFLVIVLFCLACTGQGSDSDVGGNSGGADAERGAKIIPFPGSEKFGVGGVAPATPEPLLPGQPRKIVTKRPPDEGKQVYVSVKYDPYERDDIDMHINVIINGTFEPSQETNEWYHKFFTVVTADIVRVKVSRINAAPGLIICSITQIDAKNNAYKHASGRSERPNEFCEATLTVI